MDGATGWCNVNIIVNVNVNVSVNADYQYQCQCMVQVHGASERYKFMVQVNGVNASCK